MANHGQRRKRFLLGPCYRLLPLMCPGSISSSAFQRPAELRNRRRVRVSTLDIIRATPLPQRLGRVVRPPARKALACREHMDSLTALPPYSLRLRNTCHRMMKRGDNADHTQKGNRRAHSWTPRGRAQQAGTFVGATTASRFRVRVPLNCPPRSRSGSAAVISVKCHVFQRNKGLRRGPRFMYCSGVLVSRTGTPP
jgi:hypothetical protein